MKNFPNETHDISVILENFDFDRVHRAMVALDWKWMKDLDEPGAVPSHYQLIESATRYLNEIVAEKTKPGELWATGSGGLMATVYHLPDDSFRVIELVFELDSWSNRS